MMKRSIIIAAAAVASCHGFGFGFAGVQPRPRPWVRVSHKHKHKHYAASLGASTSTPSAHQLEVEEEDYTAQTQTQRTALSMTLEELSETLGGLGRSRIAWDCIREGVDPYYLFSPDDSIDTLSSKHQQFWNEYKDKEALKKQVLKASRQTQPLGSSALNILSSLHSHCGNSIENGLATLVHISPSSDGTTKLLLRLVDGWEVETVLIPFWANAKDKEDAEQKGKGKGRTTVCISSQVGCRQGCTFCATGKMGKLRSLTTDEILVQMFFAQKMVRLSANASNEQLFSVDGIDAITAATAMTRRVAVSPLPPITNVVFMGMGEPADNADSVRGAINILTRNELFHLSASRVTVSTVAPTPEAFHEFVDSRCALAWSVHAVRDELRKLLVPTTKYTMVQLRQGLIETLKKRSLRTTMIEVALIDGVNDSIREADELADFVSEITKVPGSNIICNIIPYNDIGGGGTASSFRKPSMERVWEFQKRLQELGVYAKVRGTRGDDESAACGQLATSRSRKQKMEEFEAYADE
ncbi:23S rRNA (adenine(2503)-C(2))-methyltransferase [Skeletonema marinoi]|uniref:23S rRNA (Adenine(2503)-C(2))-methyltransferase n=1 Tax=Skeletonema marinoi TaxID=267567 RepID=A0AAD9DAZ5_9STRA|nr:23S rRNA (adenine(2503)-C(2))-methyltransferase [Skeletonema marinoi]